MSKYAGSAGGGYRGVLRAIVSSGTHESTSQRVMGYGSGITVGRGKGRGVEVEKRRGVTHRMRELYHPGRKTSHQ